MPASKHPAAADVVIIGGGIGGLANAVALGQAGFAVRVLERASQFGEVGAGLQLAPNCTRILADWELLEEVIALGVTPAAMIMRDAIDGAELTRLDLAHVRQRYGSPYVVIHRSDLHATLLREAKRVGVDLVTDCRVTDVRLTGTGASAISDSRIDSGSIVLAADGLKSTVRPMLSDDQPVSSAYVAYRGAVPTDAVADSAVSLDAVMVYVGPKCHFVQYPLRQGEMFNQVAVFESARAVAGQPDWGTPDELDAAFAQTCAQVRSGLPHIWRDRWWRMYDRDPIGTWVRGRVALTGDAAHPPLQYLAQGAVMAMEDAWVLAAQATRQRGPGGTPDWDAALAAYNSVRPLHCARVLTTARAWGNLWHRAGEERLLRNQLMRERDSRDYSYIDWLWGPTATEPAALPPMFTPQPLR